MCAFGYMGVRGDYYSSALKLMKQKFNIRQKCRMPTITTLIDGSLCARGSTRHFSPAYNATTHALHTRQVRLREVHELPVVTQRVSGGAAIQTKVGMTAGYVLTNGSASIASGGKYPALGVDITGGNISAESEEKQPYRKTDLEKEQATLGGGEQ